MQDLDLFPDAWQQKGDDDGEDKKLEKRGHQKGLVIESIILINVQQVISLRS